VIEHARFQWIDGCLYLVGYCPAAKGTERAERNREFRLDRFKQVPHEPLVTVLKEICKSDEMPEIWVKFKAKKDFAPRFRPIENLVRVLPPDEDGSRIVYIREHVPLRAVRRILSYGDNVTLLAPEYVVERYKQAVRDLYHASGQEI
jgi:predicted DNA-binding transcriptional regulator YafY